MKGRAFYATKFVRVCQYQIMTELQSQQLKDQLSAVQQPGPN